MFVRHCDPDAKNVKGEGSGERVSFPQRLGCLGERRKLPQWDMGQSPG